MKQPKSSILLIDDHHLFSDGLRGMLEKEENFTVVGQVFDGGQALYHLQSLGPDLVLLDVNLPKINGFELAKQILKDYPKVKIIVLTMYAEKQVVENFRRLGVHGYILKNATKDFLMSGIEAVLQGKRYFEAVPSPVNEYVEDEFIKKFSLTPREIEVIRLVRSGYSSQEIAEKSNLSLLTVKTHRRNIHFKIGTETTADLIRFANENGI